MKEGDVARGEEGERMRREREILDTRERERDINVTIFC